VPFGPYSLSSVSLCQGLISGLVLSQTILLPNGALFSLAWVFFVMLLHSILLLSSQTESTKVHVLSVANKDDLSRKNKEKKTNVV
jgi:hypothetical protein